MELAEQVVGILGVFGLLAIAVWVLGRKNGHPWFGFRNRRTDQGSMLVADRLVLTPQHVLHLVRIGERTLLVATHPHGVSFDPADSGFSGEFRSAMVRSREETK